MVEKTNLNVSPYYDDYDEDKNYHKILYRAGRPIQARELTQTQSILQNQIEKFGGHFFKEGSIVQGAQLDINSNTFYVKVESSNPNSNGDSNVNTYLSDFVGKFLRGQTTGVILKVSDFSEQTTSDPATLFGNFITQGTDAFNSFGFIGNEVLEEVTLNSDGVPTVNAGNNNQFQIPEFIKTNPSVGRSLSAQISEGLVYTRGFFVSVPKQSIILEKYTARGTYKVGLSITETKISSADDVSLNDNSQGTSNENAPGADRLKISLTLSKEQISTVENLNFIEMGRVLQGKVRSGVKKSVYGEFENTLAKRTYDANGDFVVQKFVGTTREHLNTGTNNGVYEADDGGLEKNFVLEISKGQAYVKGYDITKISTEFVTLNKARTTASLEGASTSVRLGNNIKITNTHSMPDLGSETTSTNTFGVLKFYDGTISTPGVASSSNMIGYGRVRDVSLSDGTDTSGIYDDTSVFNLSCFDIKMFTKLTGTTSTATFEAGDKVTGATSGATGIVSEDVLSGGSEIYVHDVVGTFQVGESVNARTNTATIATTTAVRSYNIDRVRSVFASTASGGTNFTADLVLDSNVVLTGTITLTNGNATMSGFLTRFVSELKEGDIIVGGDGTEAIVSSVTDGTTVTLTAPYSGSNFSGNVTRKRTKIDKQSQTANIFAFPRDYVSTSSVGSNTFRKQEIVTISGGQFIVETGLANTELGSVSDPNSFIISVLTAGSGSSPLLAAGDVIDLTDPSWTKSVTTGGGGVGEKVTVSSGSNINADDNNAQLLVTYTVDYTNQTRRSKTLREARCLSFESSNSSGVFYGTAYDHKDLCLGVSDVFRIRGVFEGVGGSTPLPPSAQFLDPSAVFSTFEIVVGQTTGVQAKVIKYDALGRTYFYYLNEGESFNEGEFIVGQLSKAQAEINGLSAGSPNIASRYFFDNGQRDGFYDLSKLTLKPGSPSPNNPILVLFDYFTASGGDFYDVGSYSGIDYSEIPVYSPNKVDLGGLEPDGQFELSDAVDCRPSVGQVLGLSTFSSNNPDPESPLNISDNVGSGARYAPFSYENGRSFASTRPNITVTGSSPIHTPVTGTSFNSDIEFYVARIDRVFLNKQGKFQISKGVPAITPQRPGVINDAIELYEIYVPAYTKNLANVSIKTKDYKRYTMKDIDRINKRLTNLEQVTALSLLESEALSKQILDGDGLDRFKSGFVVDNFNNHGIGDVLHPDYSCSIDAKRGQVRPAGATVNVDLKMNHALSKNLFWHSDNIVTLPYGVINYIEADKASRSISVNPYTVYDYKGKMKLSPSQDLWFDITETETAKTGNTLYDAVFVKSSAEAQTLGVEDGELMSTVWGGWQTDWSGSPSETIETTNIAGGWDGDPTQAGNWVQGTTINRTITEQVEGQSRNGIQTSVVENSTTETGNSRLKSGELQQYMRENQIFVTVDGLKPNTNHFTFFDNIDVNNYCQPLTSSFSTRNTTVIGDGLRSDSKGTLSFIFHLPKTKKLKFKTGQRMLKVTSSYYDLNNPSSVAVSEYRSDGTLLTQDTEIVTTRTVTYVNEVVSETQQITSTSESIATEPYGVSTNSVDVPADTYNITNVYNDYTIVNPTEPEPTPPPEVVDVEEVIPPNNQNTGGAELENPGDSGDNIVETIANDTNNLSVGVVLGGQSNFVGGTIPISYCFTDGTCDRDNDVYEPTSGAVEPVATVYNVTYEGSDWETGDVPNYVNEADIIAAAAAWSNGTSVTVEPTYNTAGTAITAQATTTVSSAPAGISSPDSISTRIQSFSGEDYFRDWKESNERGFCYVDPLAQSFLVTQQGGIFLHDVEVYFSKKDQSGATITCEIRNMVNGHPGNKIIDYVSLRPGSVNVSDNATASTKFKFLSPVKLEQNEEYCFVLISPSADYEVWHSRIGEADITTGQQISSQPYLGSMFKSQNTKTWTPEQTDDIKFRLNICNFNRNMVGYMRLENKDVTWKRLKRNPIETFQGQNYVKINSYSHGMYTTSSSVRLLDVEGDRKDSVVEVTNRVLSGTPSDGTYTDLDVAYASGSGGSGLKVDITVASGVISDFRISDVGQGYSVNDNLIVSNFNSGADVTFNVSSIEDTIGGFPLNSIRYVAGNSLAAFTTIANITMDSFTIIPDTSSYQGINKLENAWTALNSTSAGGRPRMLKNVYYDVGQTMIPHVQPQGTKIFSNIYPTAMSSPEGFAPQTPYSKDNESVFFTLNDNIYFNRPNVVASRLNEVDKMQSERSLDIRIQFTTDNPNVSPVFDLESMGFVAVMNRINNIDTSSDVPTGTTYVASTEPEGDNNKFVYVTKKVELQNPATSLKVFADNFRPLGTELEFMYKIIKTDEDTPVDDIGWRYFNTTGTSDIEIDADSRSFKEYSYTADDLPEFISFAIKIVGKSSNTCIVPVVTSFRALALA